MDSAIVKKNNRKFARHFPQVLPSMGWFFSMDMPKDSIELQPDVWTCMFKHIEDVANGSKICFSKHSAGCSGASCYFGFTKPGDKAGAFLATKEKFKENLLKYFQLIMELKNHLKSKMESCIFLHLQQLEKSYKEEAHTKDLKMKIYYYIQKDF